MTLEGLNFLVKKFHINEEQCKAIYVEPTKAYGDSFTIDINYLDGTWKTYKFYYRSLHNVGLSSDDVLTGYYPTDYVKLVQYLLNSEEQKQNNDYGFVKLHR